MGHPWRPNFVFLCRRRRLRFAKWAPKAGVSEVYTYLPRCILMNMVTFFIQICCSAQKSGINCEYLSVVAFGRFRDQWPLPRSLHYRELANSQVYKGLVICLLYINRNGKLMSLENFRVRNIRVKFYRLGSIRIICPMN